MCILANFLYPARVQFQRKY